MTLSVREYGDDAAYVDLDVEHSNERGARTLALARALRKTLPGADVVVGAGSVAVVGADATRVAEALAAAQHVPLGLAEPSRQHLVEAVYDGPDLEQVAATLGIRPQRQSHVTRAATTSWSFWASCLALPIRPRPQARRSSCLGGLRRGPRCRPTA